MKTSGLNLSSVRLIPEVAVWVEVFYYSSTLSSILSIEHSTDTGIIYSHDVVHSKRMGHLQWSILVQVYSSTERYTQYKTIIWTRGRVDDVHECRWPIIFIDVKKYAALYTQVKASDTSKTAKITNKGDTSTGSTVHRLHVNINVLLSSITFFWFLQLTCV